MDDDCDYDDDQDDAHSPPGSSPRTPALFQG